MTNKLFAGAAMAAALSISGVDYGRSPGYRWPPKPKHEDPADVKRKAKRKAQKRARMISRRKS